MKRPYLILILLIVLAFGLGARVQPRMVRVGGAHDSDNVFQVLLGEGRRMFANHFAVKADVYMHSGFYPSIFDQAAQAEQEEGHGEEAGHVHTAECEHEQDHGEPGHEDEAANIAGHECDTSFMGPPRDWFESMGRNFIVSGHTHLKDGQEREILPWLELSADLDPQRTETYIVTAYWLADRMGKPDEAEQFLRRGLRANPQSYEILFELGKVLFVHKKDPDHAANVWRLALRRWDEVESKKEKPDFFGRERILVYLAQAEQALGKYLQAIQLLEEAQAHSPSPEAIEERIQDLRTRFAPPPTGAP